MNNRRIPEQSRQNLEESRRVIRLAISTVIRRQLRVQRLSQSEACRQIGVSRTFLRSLLRAEKDVRFFNLLALAEGCFDDRGELFRLVLKNLGDFKMTCRHLDLAGPNLTDNVPPIDGSASS